MSLGRVLQPSASAIMETRLAPGLLLLLGAVLVLSGCSHQPPEAPAAAPAASPGQVPAAPRVGGAYLSGTSAGDAETLHWVLAADSASLGYAGSTLDGLATYDNNFTVRLRHAARPISVSPDGLRYTVEIRGDLRWSGGVPVTAEDYTYTIENIFLADWVPYNYKDDWTEEVNGSGVPVRARALNRTAFTVERRTVDPEFLDNVLLGMTPMPKHLVERYASIPDPRERLRAFTEAPEFNKLNYTGNLGPYRFAEWTKNDKYVVERNPGFYLGEPPGAPFFEKRVVKIFGSPAAKNAALEAGDITAADLEPEQVPRFKGMGRLRVFTLPSTGYLLLAYNQRDNGWPGLRDPEVRRALSTAIDKEGLVGSVLFGFGKPANSFVPDVSPFYDPSVPSYGTGSLHDRKQARETLDRLGHKNIPVLRLVTNSGNKEREDAALYVKEELRKIGVEVKVESLLWDVELKNVLRNKVPGSNQSPAFNNGPRAVSQEPWDMVLVGFSSNPIAPSGQRVFYRGDGGLNFWGYSNPEANRLFDQLRGPAAIDRGVRKDLYRDLATQLARDQPVDFLAFQLGNTGIDRRVQGIEPGINMGWNGHAWYFQ